MSIHISLNPDEFKDRRISREMKPSSGADSRPLRVLVVQHASDLSGSTISGQLLARGFCESGWHVEVAFGSAGPGMASYRQSGCVLHELPHKNWLRDGNGFQSIRRIIAEFGPSRRFVDLVGQCRPDVIYVNSLVSLAAALAACRLRIPCVWHIRELFNDVGGEMRIPACGGRSLVRKVIARCSDHTVLISDAVRENILGADWRGPSSIVPNAADEHFFDLDATQKECRAMFGLPMEGLIVGVPGSLRPVKGHEFFLDAAAAVTARETNCHFAVTGDGTPKYVEQLRQRSACLGLTGRIQFLGAVARMPQFYRACDVICIPSRAEPFGRTVIEAFAVGVPVAASAVGGIRETVEQGKTGLLVEYGNVAGMADVLIQLLEDSNLRRRLTAAANEKARMQYSVLAYQKHIRRIVVETLESRRSRS